MHDRQHYELISWRRGDAELTYRRFFAVSDLAGLRVEDPAVFAATHAEVLRWVAAGDVDGIRVDHPDGLRDPDGYLRRLRDAAPAAWLVVEKILEYGERLPDWPVQMLTNRRHSPKIADTLAYVPSENGPISLRHDYRLVLFDYPGMGRSPLLGDVTADEMANDVDAMLDGIVNFEVPVALLETRWKLSQNRGRREMELIAEQLAKSDDSVERALAALTLRHLVD